MRKKPQSSNRLHKKTVSKKFDPAIKLLSEHLYNTSGDIPKGFKFKGYECSCGTIEDAYGRVWQIKASAVVSKDVFCKENEISPIQGRWRVKHTIQTWVAHLIKWSNSNLK